MPKTIQQSVTLPATAADLMATGRTDGARAARDEAVRACRGAPRFKRRAERLWRLRAGWLRWTLRA